MLEVSEVENHLSIMVHITIKKQNKNPAMKLGLNKVENAKGSSDNSGSCMYSRLWGIKKFSVFTLIKWLQIWWCFFFIYVITCTCGRKRKAIESAAERGAERDQAAFHGAVLGWGQSWDEGSCVQFVPMSCLGPILSVLFLSLCRNEAIKKKQELSPKLEFHREPAVWLC